MQSMPKLRIEDGAQFMGPEFNLLILLYTLSYFLLLLDSSTWLALFYSIIFSSFFLFWMN